MKKLLAVLFLAVFAFSVIMPAGRALAQDTNLSAEAFQKQIEYLTGLIKSLQAQLEALKNKTISGEPTRGMTFEDFLAISDRLSGSLKVADSVTLEKQQGTHILTTADGRPFMVMAVPFTA